VVVFFLLLCKRIVGDRTSALGWAHELILTSHNSVLQGRKFSVTGLLGEHIAKDFEGGPMVIYRLAPQVSSTLWFSQFCSMFLFPLVSWVLTMRYLFRSSPDCSKSSNTFWGFYSTDMCTSVQFCPMSNVEAGLYLAMWGISGELRFLC